MVRRDFVFGNREWRVEEDMIDDRSAGDWTDVFPRKLDPFRIVVKGNDLSSGVRMRYSCGNQPDRTAPTASIS